METQRLLLYMALGFLSLLIYQAWVADYHTPVSPVVQVEAPSATTDTPATGTPAGEGPSVNDIPQAPAAAAEASAVAAVPETIDTPRIKVVTDALDVEIGTVGGTLLSLKLLNYPVSIDDKTPFALLSDIPTQYKIAESGLQGKRGEPAPTHRETLRAAQDRYTLAEGEDTLKVPLVWESGTGITVTKTFTFTRDSYVVGVDYQIDNQSEVPWVVNQYRQIKRKPATKDETTQFLNTYIGGVVSTAEDPYSKVKFRDMDDENLDETLDGGWVAMIQHYFATAWIAQPGGVNTAYSRHLTAENRYLIGMVSESVTVPAGQTSSLSTQAYIGPKIQDRMAAVEPNLRLTVDYGWLDIISQPLFWMLNKIHSVIGNWGWSIMILTLLIKLAFYKLSEAGYRSMGRMKLLQPKLAALKERHGDDRTAMGQATMELYKKEKVNPLGSCLPMIAQIPVFIALYWMLLESVELRQAPWILWIRDMSIRDPLFILPVIMGITMFIQQRLNPAPVDPIQAKVFMFLPLVFSVFFAFFPAGLVLYWIVNNTLSIAQQYYITRHVLAEKPGKGGGGGKGKKGKASKGKNDKGKDDKSKDEKTKVDKGDGGDKGNSGDKAKA